jgi:hypothetical protein
LAATSLYAGPSFFLSIEWHLKQPFWRTIVSAAAASSAKACPDIATAAVVTTIQTSLRVLNAEFICGFLPKIGIDYCTPDTSFSVEFGATNFTQKSLLFVGYLYRNPFRN